MLNITSRKIKRDSSNLVQLSLEQPVLGLNKRFLASSIYIAYMTLLLVDKFKALFALTALMFLVLKSTKGFFSKKVISLQVVFLIIAVRCFWFEIIPEGKFFVIYTLALYSGFALAPIIAAQSVWKFPLHISFIAIFVFFLELCGIHVISLEIEKDILLSNYAEVLIFNLLAAGYLKGYLNKPLLLIAALFSGSKFLYVNAMLMSISRGFYLSSIAVIVAVLFIFNPYGFLDSRLSLYEIFLVNWRMDLLLLTELISVNDLLVLENTLYSFHNIWIDYIWYGGMVGVVAIVLHFSIVVEAFRGERAVLGKSVIFMYLLCITFGFSVFFGTKYMMLMLGVIVFKRRMDDLKVRSNVVVFR